MRILIKKLIVFDLLGSYRVVENPKKVLFCQNAQNGDFSDNFQTLCTVSKVIHMHNRSSNIIVHLCRPMNFSRIFTAPPPIKARKAHCMHLNKEKWV